MAKPNSQRKNLPGRNPIDPMVLARYIVEGTGEPLAGQSKAKKLQGKHGRNVKRGSPRGPKSFSGLVSN
jgi:hypothetical protein